MSNPALLTTTATTSTVSTRAVYLWAVLGNFALLVDACARMLDAADWHARRAHADGLEWLVAAFIALAFAVGEGHYALERRFVPEVIERAGTIRGFGPSLLAPLVAAGLCYAPRARLVRSWTLVLGIVALVIAMRLLSPALHAGVDLGVALALAIGAGAMVRQGLGHALVRTPVASARR